MAYDFFPKNPNAEPYSLGAFSWPIMLEAGLGLVLGTGKGFRPGEFVYLSRPDGRCVQYNDGATVTPEECAELAKVCRWIVAIQEARIREWEKLEEPTRRMMKADKAGTYTLPWHPGYIQKFRDFATWCDQAQGFEIH